MAAKLMAQEAEAAAAAAGDPAAIAALKKKGALPQNGEAAPVPNIMADKRFGCVGLGCSGRALCTAHSVLRGFGDTSSREVTAQPLCFLISFSSETQVSTSWREQLRSLGLFDRAFPLMILRGQTLILLANESMSCTYKVCKPGDLVCRAMFEDADFVVDENAEEYRALHPNAGHRAKAKTEEERLLQEHFEQVRSSARGGGVTGVRTLSLLRHAVQVLPRPRLTFSRVQNAHARCMRTHAHTCTHNTHKHVHTQVSEDGQGSSGDSSGGDDDDDSMDEAPARAERPSKKQHKKDGLGVSNGGVSKAAAQQGVHVDAACVTHVHMYVMSVTRVHEHAVCVTGAVCAFMLGAGRVCTHAGRASVAYSCVCNQSLTSCRSRREEVKGSSGNEQSHPGRRSVEAAFIDKICSSGNMDLQVYDHAKHTSLWCSWLSRGSLSLVYRHWPAGKWHESPEDIHCFEEHLAAQM
eukprot:scaffold70929_cov18-Tisochrysis_lutea.AAC.1